MQSHDTLFHFVSTVTAKSLREIFVVSSAEA